jgi:hypothetical protein
MHFIYKWRKKCRFLTDANDNYVHVRTVLQDLEPCDSTEPSVPYSTILHDLHI